MPNVDIRDASGAAVGSIELDERIFGVQPNVAVMHQVVTAQLAAARSGSQSTKTRAEVRGGGAKPWRQKGTGRSRQGSIRSPQWRGGGVAFAPKPRDYSQRTPKKMIRLALRSALSDRAADDKIVVLDGFGIDEPKTKSAIALLDRLSLDGRVLLVTGPDDEAVVKSFRNLGRVHVLASGQLNAYDVLVSDWVVFTTSTLPEAGPPATAAEAILAHDPTETEVAPPAGSDTPADSGEADPFAVSADPIDSATAEAPSADADADADPGDGAPNDEEGSA